MERVKRGGRTWACAPCFYHGLAVGTNARLWGRLVALPRCSDPPAGGHVQHDLAGLASRQELADPAPDWLGNRGLVSHHSHDRRQGTCQAWTRGGAGVMAGFERSNGEPISRLPDMLSVRGDEMPRRLTIRQRSERKRGGGLLAGRVCGRAARTFLELPVDRAAHLAFLHERLEFAVRQGLGVRGEEHGLKQEERDQHGDEVADRERLLFGFHALTVGRLDGRHVRHARCSHRRAKKL